MNSLKIWLMRRYCPDYEKSMPADEPGVWHAAAIIVWGYWGNKVKIVATKDVEGLREAYMTSRWLALKAQWRYPTWLYNCSIHYGVKKL